MGRNSTFLTFFGLPPTWPSNSELNNGVDVKVPTRQLLLIVMISVLENCLPNNIQIRKVPTPKKTTKIHENI